MLTFTVTTYEVKQAKYISFLVYVYYVYIQYCIYTVFYFLPLVAHHPLLISGNTIDRSIAS